jgi:acyl-CoA dehydrogenase
MPHSDWEAEPKVKLDVFGAEPELPDFAAALQATLHDFALNVARPIGRELDRMSPEDAIAEGSPYWDFRKQYLALGINMEAMVGLEPAQVALLFAIANEEMGFGDSGLAISMGAGMLPQYIAARVGNEFLMKRFPESMLGCWGITEPDHGSDTLDPTRQLMHPGANYGRPNCVAKISDGKVVINGQKSAWVSNGSIADVCILYCAADTGKGPDPHRGAVVVVPLDADGVSRGKPLDKLGQRALNQGEIFFDNVTLDIDYLLADPDSYAKTVYLIHSEANSLMGSIFAGCAASAYQLALEYAHERKQGGVPIIQHQNVAHRIFTMARKVEAARALCRRVLHYNFTNDPPALQAGMMTKVQSTETAFEVASMAAQIFGGNGMSREYPIEKIMRDARASMIEDGCNEVLAIKGGRYLTDADLL